MRRAPRLLLILLAAGGLSVGAGLAAYRLARPKPKPPTADALAALIQHPEPGPLIAALKEDLDSYRKLIVLFADEAKLKPEERAAASRVGQQIHHERLARQRQANEVLEAILASGKPERFPTLDAWLSFIEQGEDLFDADRLAFREPLRAVAQALGRDGSLTAVKLAKRVAEDQEALDRIEALYEKELKAIFERFEDRGIELKRERWEDYLAKLKSRHSREAILRDYGTILPYAGAVTDEQKELTGRSLPDKTLVLTFDDGPHGVYTEEIAAILKQYQLPGLFFHVGRNLGKVDAAGQVKLGPLAELDRKLVAQGYVVGNHSYSHAQLSKETGNPLKLEIGETDALLKAIPGVHSDLFRFPYGARTEVQLEALQPYHLRSILWNIDSMDWADPLPTSIVNRVLKEVEREKKGILLFHDIHDRAVKALPAILDKLIAQGYAFAGWDGQGFKIVRPGSTQAAASTPTAGYQESWALVVGIDAYAKWPRLQHAVKDAESVRDLLTTRFGFASDHILFFKDGEATRANLLGALNGKLARAKRDDRIFIYFAGHGATRKLSSGRDLGYLIPADSDPGAFASDALPMSDLQTVAESLTAKHVFFVMDACYSGLGLTRGASDAFLRENSKRLARQMLTAGGADQSVADDGPGGHSVFTWTLLQGLNGRADLNGDGVITATELAAFTAPIVSSMSRQTPAFGSLPGSEGGEFVFEKPVETEFLSDGSAQLQGRDLKLAEALDRPATGPVVVKTLEGGETKLAAAKPTKLAPRQAAQRANDLGLRHYREQRYPEAEAQFTEALKYKPDFALAANNLGFIYFRQGKYPEAVRWFENTLKMDPSRAIAHFNLGEAAFKAGDSAKAKQALQTYLALAPNGASSAKAKDLLKGL
ncbi:MAG: polysaccharide deacetylase family protein [Acidobacteria bacterium]|nr:polysaccharide deacetylase family protein [Acidobacteriota bacterium]MBI3487238.1 polysaccharide deacetylase family protein [Acidobacteriota bacterium]